MSVLDQYNNIVVIMSKNTCRREEINDHIVPQNIKPLKPPFLNKAN